MFPSASGGLVKRKGVAMTEGVLDASLSSFVLACERLIRRDPGGRGLLGSWGGCELGLGELRGAVETLSLRFGSIGIVTGFFIPGGGSGRCEVGDDLGRAETDGPLGAAFLARVLIDLGHDVRVLTDEKCSSVVATACERHGLRDSVNVVPGDAANWLRSQRENEWGRSLTAMIAIERVGPSHTKDSLADTNCSPGDLIEYEQSVPPSDQGQCYNMRGICIDEFSGDIHRVFDELSQASPGVCQIGIGDGGNEIGMGKFAWSELRGRLPVAVGAKIPCRIATNFTVLAGTSNWGGYALAAGVAFARGRVDVLKERTVAEQMSVLQTIVSAGAVDGVTKQSELSVDGLPFLTYIQPWLAMRALLGFEP